MWSEMWSQTGLVLGQDRSETKKSVFLLQVLCCVVKYNPVTIVVIIILEDTSAFQVLVQFLYFVLGTSLLWRSTVAFTYLKVKSTKCLCLHPVVLVLVLLFRSWSWSCKQRSWSCYFLMVLEFDLVYITARPPRWWCLLSLPQEPHPAHGLRPRFSPQRASVGSLFQQFSFPPMHRGLDKNIGSAHFRSQRMHQNAGFCIKNIQKIPGSRTPDPAAEGEIFVRSHSGAHLPDAGVCWIIVLIIIRLVHEVN